MPKVLFLAPYPKGKGPSQRFRLEVYLPACKKKGIQYKYHTFYSQDDYKKLYSKKNFIAKTFIVLKGFLKRISIIPTIPSYDYVFIQREVTPLGPPFLEWLMAKVFRKKMIYDFDDAIWLANYTQENSTFHKLKSYWKVKHIIKWSWRVVAGNAYLAEYANKYNPKTTIIPTVVDTEGYHNPDLYERKKKEISKLVWTGSLTTNLHIEYLQPVLQKLEKKHVFELVVISNKKPDLDINNLKFKEWQDHSELHHLADADIGLMPLIPDFEFAKGKCGFKAIQYMSLGIPTIISPLGINKEIVSDKINGYYANNLDDWYKIIEGLLKNPSSADQIKVNARKTIQESYSQKTHENSFLSLFQ